MKVLLVNKFHYIHGGSETYHFALSEMLKNAGHDVVFFSMQDEKNFPCKQTEYFVPNVEYVGKQSLLKQLIAGFKFLYSFHAKKQLRKLIQKEKPDIAHVNLVHRQLTFSVIDELYKHGIPVVYTMHDYICICPNCTMLAHGQICEKCLETENFLSCLKIGCIKNSRVKSALAYLEATFLKKTKKYNKITLFIGPSKFIVEKHNRSKFSKSPVIFLRNFLPKETVYQPVVAYDGYLLFFGRLSPEKGIIILLNAIIRVDGVNLHIAGDGELRPEIEKFIESNNLANRVKLLGYQDRKSMAEIVSGCKAVVVPSEWYENCPYSIMEAQAQGKPVIGADIGGIPELIVDGKTGFVFKAFSSESLERSIRQLIECNENEYNKMSSAIVEFAKENYCHKSYSNELTNLYGSLTKTNIIE
ncbi:MAG: glycosyltransferase [Chitinispirillaceae bacterium]|nr:glycosyltransferase [Chitinispirillaceae bacterium]